MASVLATDVAVRWAAALDCRAAQCATRRGRLAVFLHEFVCSGIRQARACLFGGCMPALAWLARRTGRDPASGWAA